MNDCRLISPHQLVITHSLDLTFDLTHPQSFVFSPYFKDVSVLISRVRLAFETKDSHNKLILLMFYDILLMISCELKYLQFF